MKGLYTVLLFIFVMFATFFSCGEKETGETGRQNMTEKQIIETGELAAINYKAFLLERYGRQWSEMKVVGILEHGSIIKEGDSIIQLDPTVVKQSILDWEGDLETQYANLEKLTVEQAIRRNEMKSNIQNEEASFNLKKLELEASRFESDRARTIKELEYEQSKILLAKEKRKLELYDIISASDLKVQEVRVLQLKNRITDAYNVIPRLTIRTPIPGVFQIAHNWRTDGLVKVGDDIYVGNNMANVPELRQMKVNTYVNETDFLDISLGQKVAVRLDAMPELVFPGEVSYIGKLCRKENNESRRKIFDVEVVILEPDERLKPGMTVSCEYLKTS